MGGGDVRRKQPRRHLLRPNVGAGGSRKSSVSETLQRTRPGRSRLFGSAVPRVAARAPSGSRHRCAAAAAAPGIEVRNTAKPPSPPCPRIKVMPPGPRDHDSARFGLPGPARGLGIVQAAVTFLSVLAADGWAIRTRFWARERSWELTPVFQFGHIGVEPTPFL